jgi:hypothetical protein
MNNQYVEKKNGDFHVIDKYSFWSLKTIIGIILTSSITTEIVILQ